MSYQVEREQFIAQMAGKLPLSVIRTVLARANTLQRNGELSCSSEAADRDRVPCPGIKNAADCCCDQYQGDGKHETVPRIDRQSFRIERELRRLLGPKGIGVNAHGDPRGYVLHLTIDGREIGVPSRGLPASFWERN